MRRQYDIFLRKYISGFPLQDSGVLKMGRQVYPEDRSRVARNPEHPTEDVLQRQPKKPGKRKTIAVVIIVLVVVIAGISASIYVMNHHSTHIAVVSASVVTSLSKKQFTVAYDNASALNISFNVTKGEWVYFNVTSLGFIIISSLELTSSSTSLSFFNEEYHSAIRLFNLPNNAYILSNGSYNGFNYFVLTQNASMKTVTGTTIASIGYSGSYAFSIFDAGIPLTSYTALIDDEIQAMTG